MHSGRHARNMSIKSLLIIVISFLSILAAGTDMLGTLAAALLGYFLVYQFYRDWGGEPDKTAGQTGWRKSDRGGRLRGCSLASPGLICPTRLPNMRLLEFI